MKSADVATADETDNGFRQLVARIQQEFARILRAACELLANGGRQSPILGHEAVRGRYHLGAQVNLPQAASFDGSRVMRRPVFCARKARFCPANTPVL